MPREIDAVFTPSREKQVDFISYDLTMNEIVVTGVNAPALGAVEDLAGHSGFVRRSSSYYETLTALSNRLQAAGKLPVREILELTHAGVVPITELKNALAAFMETHGSGTEFGLALDPNEDVQPPAAPDKQT